MSSTGPRDNGLADVHTPVMILNALVLAFTIQLVVTPSADDYIAADLSELSYRVVTNADLRNPTYSSKSVTWALTNLTITIVSLLISMFSMLFRYASRLVQLDARLVVKVEIIGVLAVSILTIISLGMLINITILMIHLRMPLTLSPKVSDSDWESYAIAVTSFNTTLGAKEFMNDIIWKSGEFVSPSFVAVNGMLTPMLLSVMLFGCTCLIALVALLYFAWGKQSAKELVPVIQP